MTKKQVLIILCQASFLIKSFCITPNELLTKIREKLPDLRDSSIGVIDSNGDYIKDNNKGLNCSGFAKWIVDGFYTPLCNNNEAKYMSIQKLRTKHLDERGTRDVLIYEDSRDPYFGLDWTRNLAVELGIKKGENPSYKTYDIIDSTISEYIMNCGYPLWKIEKVIIEQESLHPGRIYLGSVNGFFGENPILWQHYHIAIFIPYYENGVLRIAVFERNKETSFDYLEERYPGTYCHLVWLSIEGDFELMDP